MLTDTQKIEIQGIVRDSLDRAQSVWLKHGTRLALDEAMIKAMTRADSVETISSRIPGHPTITLNEEKIDKLIALVADMRDSSQHLLCAISQKTASVSELQRVYYETSALRPALEMTVEYEGGAVTEYLGDGILGLFQVKDDDLHEAIRSAYGAARNCIGDTLLIVNSEIESRYRLPALQIGVGLGMSDAIISLVGLEQRRHAKAIGRCIYNATKLSGGKNQIHGDATIEREWPTSKGGLLKFKQREMKGVSGFLIETS